MFSMNSVYHTGAGGGWRLERRCWADNQSDRSEEKRGTLVMTSR